MAGFEHNLKGEIERAMPDQTYLLRHAAVEDQQFLFSLYARGRAKEVAAWGWNAVQQEMFLRLQFNAQQRWYEVAYQGAEHNVVLCEGKPVGQLLVLRKDREILLVDIAIMPEYQNRGLGTKLLQALIAESEDRTLPVRLQVQHTNPAKHLYERLGFSETSKDDVYSQMERQPVQCRS